MKTLYVNGDSHSAGHDAGGPEFAYGRHIANALQYEYVCDAVAGCSNDSIIDRTLTYLETNIPDFVIIGWSTWERETWYWNSEPYTFTSSGSDTVHPLLKDFYKQWVIDSVRQHTQIHYERNSHTKIYLLHNLLKAKNIKHLFFNAYSSFFYTAQYNTPKYSWGDKDINYYCPYNRNEAYYFWLENQGFTPSNPEFYHYGPDAHVAWANHMLPIVQNILTKIS